MFTEYYAGLEYYLCFLIYFLFLVKLSNTAYRVNIAAV